MRPKVDLALRAIKAVSGDDKPAPEDPVAAVLRRSPLFDAAFYRAALAARGLGLDGLEPLEHYRRHGDAARVPPNPLFDPRYYASRNPDVVRAGVNLLVARSHLAHAKAAAESLNAAGIGNDRIVYLPMRGQDTPTPEQVAEVARVSLPRSRGHLRCEGESVHGTEKATELYQRVQGRDGGGVEAQREEHRAVLEGGRADGDVAAGVGEAG